MPTVDATVGTTSDATVTTTVNIVLVRSIYPTNVGACARALGNMGGHRLILVDPQCDIDSKARQGAAGAQRWLSEVSSYGSWDDFYESEGTGIRIGFTRRSGRQRPANDFRDTIKDLYHNHRESFTGPVYLVFGPEDHGLAAEDLALMNHCCYIPTFGEFPSMNLSQAVLLAHYLMSGFLDQHGLLPTLSSTAREDESAITNPLEIRSAKPRKLFFPDQTIREWITTMGFDIEARKASAYITFKRLLLSNTPTDNDLMVLESILRQNIRKITEKQK